MQPCAVISTENNTKVFKTSLEVNIMTTLIKTLVTFTIIIFKEDSNPNDKYDLSERAPWTMNFNTSIINIGWKMGKLWAFQEINMANI